MNTDTLSRIRQHEIAKDMMANKDFTSALDVMTEAQSSYGVNVQMTFDIASCYRQIENYQDYFQALTVADTITTDSIQNLQSRFVAQYMAAQNKLYNLEVASCLEDLTQLVWLPGISNELRRKVATDYVTLNALFSRKIDWQSVDLFYQRAPHTALGLAIAVAKGNFDFSNLDPKETIDPVVLERLIHAEKILHDSTHVLEFMSESIRKSDLQYLNLILDNPDQDVIYTGLAIHSRFDFVLRQLFQTDMTKINLANVVAQTQMLSSESQVLWRKLTTRKNAEILKITVDHEEYKIDSEYGSLDLGRKRIHMKFFSEFCGREALTLEDLAHDVWNQRYDAKVYNRIRIFIQRLNKELYPITGRQRTFQLETPVVRVVGDVQIFKKNEDE